LARTVYVLTCTPYMTVCIVIVISLPSIQYIHLLYIWFWPTLVMSNEWELAISYGVARNVSMG